MRDTGRSFKLLIPSECFPKRLVPNSHGTQPDIRCPGNFWRTAEHKRVLTGFAVCGNMAKKGDACESDRRDGPGCGNGRYETGGTPTAAACDQRRRRSGSCIGIREHRAELAIDL